MTMFLAGEGLKICLRETVHKEDKDKTKKKRRILAFVNWKMPKLALILKSVRKFVVFFLFTYKTNMPSKNVERKSVNYSVMVPVPFFSS